MTPSPDTIAAIATPPGRGGIGVVRVSGGAVPAIAAALLARPLTPRRATLTTFRDARGAPLDQGLALLFTAPDSYTGEHVLELHGHGGPAVLRLLLARCIELGARLAQPGEFTQRAFLNGKLDLAQAEAVADLIAAATTTAARAAARSLSGVFSDEIRALVDALIELRMFTEATLDFPDEDIDFLRAADARGKLAAIRARLASVLNAARQGALLRDGLSIVLVGEPNVGKSSLLNRLCGTDVAIVTPIPGTTRDAIASEIEIGGIPLTVVDTAGLRPTDDPIETLGIERTWAAVRRADLALVLVDARAANDGSGSTSDAILAQLPAALPRIIVHNKIDLCAGEADRVARVESGDPRRGSAGTPAAPRLCVRENRRRRRGAAARDAGAGRRAGGDGRGVPRARAALGRAARCRGASRGRGRPTRAGRAAARAPGRGAPRGADGARDDHRRLHRGRPAGRHLFALLSRQMNARSAAAGLAGVVLGGVAGALCSRIGTPIPWMLGPLFALAALRVAGAPITAPPGGRQAGQWIIGTSLGLYFTPHVIREVGGLWPLLAIGAAFAIGIGYVSGLALARLAGIDRTTAIFASVPGGAAEMAVLGDRFGARVDRVAVAQSLRILIVVALVPTAYALLGLHGSDRYVPGMSAFDARGFALLMAATAAGGAVAQWLRLPNAFVLGRWRSRFRLPAARSTCRRCPRSCRMRGNA